MRIVIVLEGGIVQGVHADGQDVQYVVVDRDDDAEEPIVYTHGVAGNFPLIVEHDFRAALEIIWMKTGSCFYCGLEIVDGRAESGWTGIGPDWMTPGGDFGCDRNPCNDDEGTGSHRTRAEVFEMLKLAELEDTPQLGTIGNMRMNLYGAEVV